MSGDCRVETREGSASILLVAPHLEEDNTDFITEYIAEKLDCYYVINKGWERSSSVDFLNDKANCNDLDQLLSDEVLKDEFLMPIVKFANKSKIKWDATEFDEYSAHIFIIHGFGVNTSKKPPDIVLGTGSPDRLSCKEWKRDFFSYLISQKGIDIREGAGRFAGRSRNNLNQFFKRKTDLWERDSSIHSFQIEIEHAWRKDKIVARVMAEALEKAIEELVTHPKKPDGFTFPLISYS